MKQPISFRQAIVLDLAHGHSHGKERQRSVIVPTEAFAQLAAHAGESVCRQAGVSIGKSMGQRLLDRAGNLENIREGTLEAMTHALASEVALAGISTLSFERWGQAVVLQFSDIAWPDSPSSSALLEGLSEGLLSEISGRSVAALTLQRTSALVRVLIGSSATLTKVSGWIAQGVSWAEAIGRLHQESASKNSEVRA